MASPPRAPPLTKSASTRPLPLSEQAALLGADSAVLSGGGPSRFNPRGLAGQSHEPATAVPLHRRVKIEGLSGRFLRAVVSALAGNTAGSAHILIDVSLTPTHSQLDASALAAMLQTIGSLFGLSCDMLVCHAQTTSVDFSHGPLIIGAHAASAHPHGGPHHHQGSFSMPGSHGQSLLPIPSPELGPTSQFLHSHPPPPDSLQLPPTVTVDLEDEPDSDSAALNEDSDDDGPRIPLPPPLPTHLHAPRRQHASNDIAFDAPTQYHSAHRGHRHADSSMLPYENPPMLLQQSSYNVPPASGDLSDAWYHGGDAAYGSGGGPPTGRRKLRPQDSFSPLSPSPDYLNTVYSRGPIFSNIFIAHHLHNASKEVQDVLLQALKLKQIVVDGLPVNLPAIHLCIATHSQTVRHASSGISHRLEDEFVMDIMADANFFHSFDHFIHAVEPRIQPHLPIPWEAIKQLINEDESSNGIHMSAQMGQYIRDIAIALRQHGRVAFGPSPQGVKAFIHAAKCHAFFGGCNFVRPVDIDSVAEDALCHRILLRAATGPWSKPHSARLLINHMIGKVLLPPK